MRDFALHLEKIAQVGAMPVSPAQIYAARKAEKEYEGLLKADSPKAFATAITGGILSGLGIPVLLGAGSMAAEGGLERKVQKLHGQAYLKEALTGLYGFKGDDAAQIASAMISSRPVVNRSTNEALQIARLKLTKTLTEGPLPGVSDDVRDRIVKRGKAMVDDLGPKLIFSGAQSQQDAIRNLQHFNSLSDADKLMRFSQLKDSYRSMSTSGHFPTSLGFPGFSSDEAEALLSVGAEMYKRRTGKPLDSTRTALKIVSKHLGNSIKAGLPIALLSAGIAAKSQAGRAREVRAIRDTDPDPFGAF